MTKRKRQRGKKMFFSLLFSMNSQWRLYREKLTLRLDRFVSSRHRFVRTCPSIQSFLEVHRNIDFFLSITK